MVANHEVRLVHCVILIVRLIHATEWGEMDVVDLRVRYLIKLLLASVLYQINLLLELIKASFGGLFGC